MNNGHRTGRELHLLFLLLYLLFELKGPEPLITNGFYMGWLLTCASGLGLVWHFDGYVFTKYFWTSTWLKGLGLTFAASSLEGGYEKGGYEVISYVVVGMFFLVGLFTCVETAERRMVTAGDRYRTTT